jgi:hypothetical protein
VGSFETDERVGAVLAAPGILAHFEIRCVAAAGDP